MVCHGRHYHLHYRNLADRFFCTLYSVRPYTAAKTQGKEMDTSELNWSTVRDCGEDESDLLIILFVLRLKLGGEWCKALICGSCTYMIALIAPCIHTAYTYISISLIYPDYMRSISSHGRPFSLGFQVSQTMCCKRQSVATTAVCALPLLLKLGASGGASHGVCHRNLHYEVTRKRF